MLLTKSTILNLGVMFVALLVGISLESKPVQSTVSSFQPQERLVTGQRVATPNKITAQKPTAATLVDGNYQLCSQPDPHSWQDGAGVCSIFQKVGRQVSGYYGYPHSDNFICLKGKIDENLITGEALEISGAGREWTDIPQSAFKWDLEGRLTLSQGTIVRTVDDVEGRIDWLLFRKAALNLGGFYQYSSPRMTPPSQLCKW